MVADPDRVPRAAATRMVSSYARATAYDATNVAMRQGHFTGATRIGVPLTVAFGEHDRLIRPARLRVPGARTLVLPGCGHIPMWDRPDLVSRAAARDVRQLQILPGFSQEGQWAGATADACSAGAAQTDLGSGAGR